MSVTLIVSVHCDKCGVWTYGPDGSAPTDRISEARRRARSVGWERIAGRDLCPGCAAPPAAVIGEREEGS